MHFLRRLFRKSAEARIDETEQQVGSAARGPRAMHRRPEIPGKPRICPHCHGNGYILESARGGVHDCTICDSQGEIVFRPDFPLD